jgi:hypothetical protein
MRFFVGLIFMLSYLHALAADSDSENWKWYKYETTCADYKIKVRTSCHSPNLKEEWHSSCGYQEIKITNSKNQSVTKDVHEKDNLLPDEARLLSVLRCAIAPDKTPYILMLIDNGGSCDTCELGGEMDLHGNWKSYGDKWYNTSAAERKKINKLDWHKFKEHFIRESILDENQK